MKKIVCTILSILMCVGLLSGCGTSLEGDSSVVYVDKKGKVISLDVEELEQDYYDETELQNFVEEAVKAYTDEHGKSSVKVDSITVKDGIAKLKMQYKTPEDYTSFNGIELYHGKVVASLAAGYVFDGEFARVEDGKVTGTATKQEIYAKEDLKVVIIRANTDVKVDGEICYVSCENVKLTGADSVSIREGYYLETGAAAPAVDVAPQEAVNGTEQAADTENVVEAVIGTENTGAAEEEPQEAADDGSFETEVYTFIVYK